MAEKRMFSMQIIGSDAFTDMPLSAQALYFHLGMRADDDGFINNPRQIQRMTGASEDDLKILVAKKFIIPFDSGIVAIKHWLINNTIQKDRYKETAYLAEKAQLAIKENKAYTLMDTNCIQSVSKLDTKRIQTVSKVDTQIRLDKNRLDKDSIGKDSIGKGDDIDIKEKGQTIGQWADSVIDKYNEITSRRKR